MKKKSLAMLLTLSLTASLFGCGKGKKETTEDTGLTEIETTEGVSEEEQGYVRPEQNTEDTISNISLEEEFEARKQAYVIDIDRRDEFSYTGAYGFYLPIQYELFNLEDANVYTNSDCFLYWKHVYTDEWLQIETISGTTEDEIKQKVDEQNASYEVYSDWENYECVENIFQHKAFYLNKDADIVFDVFVHTRLDGKVGVISCMFMYPDEWIIMLHSMHELSEQSEKKWGNYTTNQQDTTENDLQTETQDSDNQETESEDIESNSEDTTESDDTVEE